MMLVGTQIGPFEIERELGSGAMGTVYKARFNRDGKVIPIALKVVSLGLLGNDGAMARFEREANILKQLKHPHIVRLIATGRYKQTPFIAMEFVDGQTLDHVLELRRRIGWEDCAGWAKQLCQALQHAHEKGIVHRDLKPSNLMITRDGVLKLTDFGIAKDSDMTALTGANSTIGTAAYMSPEQCKGEKTLNAKSDLYSLGVVLYELVTGKKPFTAETTVDMFLKHVNEVPVRPRRVVPDLPIWFDNLIMFLLEKDKNLRPLDAATVEKMLSDIEEKVSSQKSIGEEVANARRMDRPLAETPLDEADKEAARSLRGSKKKKKKKAGEPFYRKLWFSVVAVVLFLGTIAFGVYQIVKPPSMDVLYANIESAPPDQKLLVITEFLKNYGTTADPRVDKVRELFKQEKAREVEAILMRRYNSKALKSNWEGFDEAPYTTAMLAMDAERDGSLTRAADLWTGVRENCPSGDAFSLTDDDALRKFAMGWVADKRLADIRQAVPATRLRIQKELEDERIHEVPREWPAGSPESLAVRALRYEQFGDWSRAKVTWDRLLAETEKDQDARVWFLLAAEQLVQLGSGKDVTDDPAARLAKVQEIVTQLEDRAKLVEGDANALVPRREVRIGCREIIALYGDDPTPAIQEQVAKAKKALESVPKK